jgi:predicted molibdopterin-dependent oxidoreductase YjgC
LGSLQWPCPTTDHAGTKFLHGAKIARGLGLFRPAVFKPSAELPCAEYPLIMTTGRVLYHYHTRTMTGKVDGLNKLSPESFVEINPAMAKKLGIKDGDKIAVSTRRGKIESTAKLTGKLKESVIFMPFHFADGAANTLTNPVLDPIAKIPEYKSCAAKVELLNRV